MDGWIYMYLLFWVRGGICSEERGSGDGWDFLEMFFFLFFFWWDGRKLEFDLRLRYPP